MVILNQVLQEVHSFLGLDLIYFDQVLQKEKSAAIKLLFRTAGGLMKGNQPAASPTQEKASAFTQKAIICFPDDDM